MQEDVFYLDTGVASWGRRLFYGFAGLFFLAAGLSELVGITENGFLVLVEFLLGAFFLGWGLLQPTIKRHFGRLRITLSETGMTWQIYQLRAPRTLTWDAIEALEWDATKVRLTNRRGRTFRIPHPTSPQASARLHDVLTYYVGRHDIRFEQWNERAGDSR